MPREDIAPFFLLSADKKQSHICGFKNKDLYALAEQEPRPVGEWGRAGSGCVNLVAQQGDWGPRHFLPSAIGSTSS